MTDQARLIAGLADRYRIERELGQGGMATVYLAHDLRHDRKVALKVLRPELAAVIGAERFLAEIKTTANLQHPHILPLFDSGQTGGRAGGQEYLFYVMPFVEGESLRDKLNREKHFAVDEAVRVVREVAGALQHAHDHGVIHRDIKPENVLLSAGHALVADFGIALATAGDGRLTTAGMSLGTPAYMSPEQAAADRELDHRSDQYGLACVAWELIAGQPPFTGTSPAAVMARHVCDPVPSLASVRADVPRSVAAAIERALAKAPLQRFERIADFATALAEPAQPAADRSIVVLPFGNLSPDPEDAFFADGLAEEIITDLARVRELRVISVNSARRLKGTDKDTRTIGRELNVRYVLEGTVRRAGERLRVTSQLIEAATESQLWADRFTGTMADAFEIQEQIARRIADALAVRFGEGATVGRKPFRSPKAFEYYVQAKQVVNLVDSQGIDPALSLIDRALALEGEHPELLALKGFAVFMRQNVKGGAFESFPEALACVDRALVLDPECTAALTTRAILEMRRPEVDSASIVRHLLRSREIERSVWTGATLGYTVAMSGHVEQAIALMRDDLELDPLDPAGPIMWAFIHMFRSPPSSAAEMSGAFLKRFPALEMPLFVHALIVSAVGEPPVAVDALGAVPGGGVFGQFARALRHALLGERDQAVTLLELPLVRDASLVDDENCWIVARCYARLGLLEEAMWWLELAAHRGFVAAQFVAEVDRMLIPLRNHPGMPALLDFMRRRSDEIARDSGLLEARFT